MKKFRIGVAAIAAASVLSIGVAAPAWAQSGNFSGVDCIWPAHAFLEIHSAGTQYLAVTGTNNQRVTSSWGPSSELRRNYLNSPTEDASSGYASTSASSWFRAGWGCSI